MSSENTQKYLQQEESLSQECKELISTLPKTKLGESTNMYKYQGFWYPVFFIKGVASFQKHFQAKDSDIFLVTHPKSGTTWLKAIMFTLLTRKTNPVGDNHPLLTHNPHDLVPNIEHVYREKENPETRSSGDHDCPSLFATHTSYITLPETLKDNPTCKVIYLCRDPKDTFVSLWHFLIKLRVYEEGNHDMGEAFESFCNGLSLFGPYWDHVLEYWKQSKENPKRVFFLKYEDLRREPGVHLRRLSEFLECPFEEDEEEKGVVERILKLCSFNNLRNLEVNKKGKAALSGIEKNAHFRRGEVGDWKNHLSVEMAQRLDHITKEKFFGSGLVL